MSSVMKISVATLALLVGAAGCSAKTSTGNPPSGGSVSGGGTYSFVNCEPQHLIPHNDYESCGSQVFEAVWTRLMNFDPTTFAPVPAQADSVAVSSDGLTYTIKIKPDWTFHNGEPVTAQSYVDAWNYTAYGPNGYILNFFFDKIAGYDAMNPSSGKPTAKTLSGLKVVDATTFTVTLNAPFSQFEATLGFDAFDPLPKAFFADPKAFDEQPIGDGPYMMDGKWQHDQTINLKRYDGYAGAPGFADKVQLPIYQGDAAWLDFQAGNLDITNVGSSHIAAAKQQYPDTLQEQPSSTLLWLSFPIYDKRFQNPAIRQALSMAVDRQSVMNAILIAEHPADDFAPPVVSGYRQGVCTYCVYNAAAAKQKLADAGGWSGPLTLTFPGNDTVLEQAMEAVATQWKDNLGIDVQLNPINPNSYYTYTSGHKSTGPWWDGWVEDYPSLQDYLEPIYGKNGGYNLTGYNNPQLDALLAKGDSATTPSQAADYYRQADDIVLNDMPAMPWGFLGFNTVNSPNVTNVLKVPGLDLLALEKVQVVGVSSSTSGSTSG